MSVSALRKLVVVGLFLSLAGSAFAWARHEPGLLGGSRSTELGAQDLDAAAKNGMVTGEAMSQMGAMRDRFMAELKEQAPAQDNVATIDEEPVVSGQLQ